MPEKIQVMQALINVRCLVAVLENKKVATRIGRKMVFGMRLKYTHMLTRVGLGPGEA